MESVFVSDKSVLFEAMEVFVIGALGTALIVAVYQIVQDRVQESRLLDQVTPETQPIHRQA